MIIKKIAFLAVAAFSLTAGFGGDVFGQDRPRVAKTISSRPLNEPPAASPVMIEPQKSSTSTFTNQNSLSRPVLTNKIEVVPSTERQPLVKKTGSTSPVNMMAAVVAKSAYSTNVSGALMHGIQTRYGIPYLYGSTGPNRYDCSGFVWSVFRDAGIDFERTSVRSLWEETLPVTGDDRYKFGTLVFLNGLGHIGIVADENGFYHASSSKGITYSKFEGYWEKRIVGFRRIIPKN
jgi:cell wall-associated NlpC family hydrolase